MTCHNCKYQFCCDKLEKNAQFVGICWAFIQEDKKNDD